MLALVSAAFAGEAGAAAARVDFSTSGVTVAGRDGRARPLAKGTELDSGDTVRTGSDGRAQLRFSDGSYVSLQPNTDFAISDYKFEGKDDDRGFFGLVRGAMRTVTGAVGRVNRNSYRITTPTATVGIRGTGGVVQVLPDGSTLVIGTSGIWSLTNPAGSIDIPAGVSGIAPTEPNQPPKETTTQPQTSPAPVQPQKTEFVQGDQVNPDGTAAIFPAVLVSGPGYATAFSFQGGAAPGVSQLISGGNATATFDGSGQLVDVTIGGQTYKTTGTTLDFGTDGILAWGRWTGQMTTTSTACGVASAAPCSATFAADQGLHYVIGMPTPVMPTQGAATYSLLGATQPTYATGGTGTFSGTLSIDFPSSRVLGSFTIGMADGRGYLLNSSGNASGAFFSLSTGVTATGTASCSSGCTAGVDGFFAGANAERAGISYHVRESFPGNKDIFGAAAFKRN